MMAKDQAKLVNLCAVFISKDVQKTVQYYVEQLGFKYSTHYDQVENFATVYRDAIEIVIVQAKHGKIESNTKRYGVGYDAYIDPATVEGVDLMYKEFQSKDVTIVSEPQKTSYGSYEFVIKDIDGRLIGIGRVADQSTFFKNSNVSLD
jgi:predicted lactoylglutathione lyase